MGKPKVQVTPKKGKPSVKTQKIADAIVSGLMDGMSLVKICEKEGMPHRRTVLRWMEADAEFATKCARARELQADLMDDKIMDLIEATTPETASADRIKLAALQWRAAKLQPKKYGDKVSQELSGPDGAPVRAEVKVVIDEATEARIAARLLGEGSLGE